MSILELFICNNDQHLYCKKYKIQTLLKIVVILGFWMVFYQTHKTIVGRNF